MAQGTVNWLNYRKGFGLIQPDDGSKDSCASARPSAPGCMALTKDKRSPSTLLLTQDGQVVAGKSARGLIGIVKNHNRDVDAMAAGSWPVSGLQARRLLV